MWKLLLETPLLSKASYYSDPAIFSQVGGYCPLISLGFQVVIACLGNHAIKNQPSLIDTALAGGVRHWYPSEFGADLTIGDNWNERYYRDKVLTRVHLQKRASENPEFGYTYFLDGRFTEWAPTPHFGSDMKTHTAHIVGEPDMEQSLLSVKE